MIYPSKKEYLIKAQSFNLIPVYKEFFVDTETPASIFIKAGGLEKKSFLLESIEGAKNLSRYSFIGMDNEKLINFSEGYFELKKIDNKKNIKITTDRPMDELQKMMSDFHLYKNPELDHFVGGAVGYLSYDLVKYFDKIPLPGEESLYPEMLLFLTDLIIVFDHIFNKMKIIATVKIDSSVSPQKAYALSVSKIEELERKIFSDNINLTNSNFYFPANKNNNLELKSNFKKEDFMDSVEKAKRHIVNGDIFQIVLSQRFFVDSFSDSFNIYRALRTVNPSPYMYFLNFQDFKMIGSSPEPLLKIKGKKVMTFPIAGTRKRGDSKREDNCLIRELKNDEKEKAEHNMLVDLARNDLGRVCEFGSIKVAKYMYIEKYSHVMHLVSRLEGVLKNDKTIYDALRSAFPAGTLSGAPKIRAMQIISELEPGRRGPYGGIVGYFSYDGDLDCCITIRTALLRDNTVYIQSGAGIVYDSDSEKEYEETVNKASALLKAIRIV